MDKVFQGHKIVRPPFVFCNTPTSRCEISSSFTEEQINKFRFAPGETSSKKEKFLLAPKSQDDRVSKDEDSETSANTEPITSTSSILNENSLGRRSVLSELSDDQQTVFRNILRVSPPVDNKVREKIVKPNFVVTWNEEKTESTQTPETPNLQKTLVQPNFFIDFNEKRKKDDDVPKENEPPKTSRKIVQPNFVITKWKENDETKNKIEEKINEKSKEEENNENIPPPPSKYADDNASLELEVHRANQRKKDQTNFIDPCFGIVTIFEVVKQPMRIFTRHDASNFKKTKTNENGSTPFDDCTKSLHKSLKIDWGGCRYVDTHCHLDLIFGRTNVNTTKLNALKTMYNDSWSPNYVGCITGFCFPDSYTAPKYELWDKILENENVWAAVGCHPRSAKSYNEIVDAFIQDRAKYPNVVAVGELGLDYNSSKNVDREVQKKVLERQLEIGVRMVGQPLLLHCRDAEEDCFNLFQSKVPHGHPIHWHCFSYGEQVAKKWSDHFTNIYFGVTPAVCYQRSASNDLEGFCTQAPLNRLLIETDSPYFLPPNYRTKEYGSLEFSHPGIGALVAIKLAELKKQPVKEVFEKLYENTVNLYKIEIRK